MKETEKLELKKSLTQLKEGIISCSAMLNKNHSGTVIFPLQICAHPAGGFITVGE